MANIVIVGLDGSEGSRRALDFAIRRAKAGQHELLLACVIPHSTRAILTIDELTRNEAWRLAQRERAEREILGPALALAAEAGVRASTRIEFGEPAEVLGEIAKEIGASHIVVGRRGLSRIKALLFGSVAASLVQTAPVPVTVVP
ncbi:MAG: universal stress protein [Xanthomonadales bacterium]|nr:universal stress protein [Xanthomonadales bacterium]